MSLAIPRTPEALLALCQELTGPRADAAHVQDPHAAEVAATLERARAEGALWLAPDLEALVRVVGMFNGNPATTRAKLAEWYVGATGGVALAPPSARLRLGSWYALSSYVGATPVLLVVLVVDPITSAAQRGMPPHTWPPLLAWRGLAPGDGVWTKA